MVTYKKRSLDFYVFYVWFMSVLKLRPLVAQCPDPDPCPNPKVKLKFSTGSAGGTVFAASRLLVVDSSSSTLFPGQDHRRGRRARGSAHQIVQPPWPGAMPQLGCCRRGAAATRWQLPAVQNHRQGQLRQGQAGQAHADWPRGEWAHRHRPRLTKVERFLTKPVLCKRLSCHLFFYSYFCIAVYMKNAYWAVWFFFGYSTWNGLWANMPNWKSSIQILHDDHLYASAGRCKLAVASARRMFMNPTIATAKLRPLCSLTRLPPRPPDWFSLLCALHYSTGRGSSSFGGFRITGVSSLKGFVLKDSLSRSFVGWWWEPWLKYEWHLSDSHVISEHTYSLF